MAPMTITLDRVERTSATVLATWTPTVRAATKWLVAVTISCAALILLVRESQRSGEQTVNTLRSAPDSHAVQANLDAAAGRPLVSAPIVTSASFRGIFSDTAMAPPAYNDENSCQSHIR